MYERDCVTNADAVVLNTYRSLEQFRAVYQDQPPEKFLTITNGYDPELATAREPPSGQPRAPCTHGRQPPGTPIRLCHPGELYGRCDPRTILMAVKALRSRGIAVELEQIGWVEPSFHLEDFIRQNNLEEHVILRGSVPHATAMKRMDDADLLLVIQPDAALMVPGKLYEMLLFRKPIVAITGEGETADIVRKFELGAIGDPQNEACIAQAIQEAAAMTAISTEGWIGLCRL